MMAVMVVPLIVVVRNFAMREDEDSDAEYR